jgi:hypothetical protein
MYLLSPCGFYLFYALHAFHLKHNMFFFSANVRRLANSLKIMDYLVAYISFVCT